MKRILTALTLYLSFAFSNMALSEAFDATGKPLNVDHVAVYLSDNAQDGCWTNLGETKKYAEDKLLLKNYKLYDESAPKYYDRHYILNVFVSAWRPYDNGACVGVIDVHFGTTTQIEDVEHRAMYAQEWTHNIFKANLNSNVLDKVKSLIESLPRNGI